MKSPIIFPKASQQNYASLGKTAFIFSLYLLWSYETIIQYSLIVLARISKIDYQYWHLFYVFFFLLLLICSIPYIIRFLKIADLLAIIGVVLLVSVTLMFPTEFTKNFSDYSSKFFLSCLPLYFVGRALGPNLQDESFVNRLFFISILSIISTVLSILVSGFSLIAPWSSNMSYPYILLPHMMLVFKMGQKKNKWISLPIFIAGLIFMVFLGNRGALICLFFYMFILAGHAFLKVKSQKKIMVIFLFVLILIFAFATNLMDSFVVFLYNKSLGLGFSTRIFDFLKGNITEDFSSGRISILFKLLDAIAKNPLGYGLSADVSLVGGYSHNLLVEIWVEFGVFLGTFFILFIAIIIFKALTKKHLQWETIELIWLLVCAGIVKLFLSGTYLNDPYFFLSIGACISMSFPQKIPVEKNKIEKTRGVDI